MTSEDAQIGIHMKGIIPQTKLFSVRFASLKWKNGNPKPKLSLCLSLIMVWGMLPLLLVTLLVLASHSIQNILHNFVLKFNWLGKWLGGYQNNNILLYDTGIHDFHFRFLFSVILQSNFKDFFHCFVVACCFALWVCLLLSFPLEGLNYAMSLKGDFSSSFFV